MQHLFSAKTYQQRRAKLKAGPGSGLVLFIGNDESPMNFSANPYPFRQDSTFLYYFGLDLPGLRAVIDLDTGEEILYGDDYGVEDIVWMGSQPSLGDLAERIGVSQTRPLAQCIDDLRGKHVLYLPPYREEHHVILQEILGHPREKIAAGVSEDLVRAVVQQRSVKEDEEIAQMEEALVITAEMHKAIMEKAGPGWRESELAGIAQRIAHGHLGRLAYSAIVTVNGHILHNHAQHQILGENQMLLVDVGAENKMHYAGDITRTVPTSPSFTTMQKELYQVCLQAQEACIQAVQPGVPFVDIHLKACRIIAEGLKQLGLMRGNPDEAVQEGAHALFFPHGLGHMIGLDVHDMENLGENAVGYDGKYQRSSQFGLAYLRLAKKLEAGYVLTVEPGIYFIPELIDIWKADKKLDAFIDYRNLEKYRTAGGIRIEDNILVTQTGYQILGPDIPKKIEEIENLHP